MIVLQTATKRKLHGAFGVAISVATAVLGVLLIIQVWRIFLSAEVAAFTVKQISQKFNEIAPFVWIWLALAIGGGVAGLLFPQEQAGLLPQMDLRITLQRLKRRLTQNEGGMYAVKVQKLRLTRVVAWCVLAVVAVVAVVVSTNYLLSGSYEPQAQTGFFALHEEAERIVRCLPWIFGGFAVGIATALVDRNSVQAEIVAVKTQIAENAKQGVKMQLNAQNQSSLTQKLTNALPFLKTKTFLWSVRAVVGIVGVVFVIVGINGGGMDDVLEKAINICTQCIGLG